MLTPQEVNTVVKLLDKCKPGDLPPELFNAVARLSVMAAVEFVPLRRANNTIEVLLIERPPDDITWPGMLHTPGTILRPYDTSFRSGFKRLFEDELGNMEGIEPLYTGFNLGRGDRGAVVTFEHILDLTDYPVTLGHYYPYSKLPSNFIPEQQGLIERAVKKFREL